MEESKGTSRSDESINVQNFSSTEQLTDSKPIEIPAGKDDYDPFAERRVEHPTSDAGALAHLLKCSLGSGILAMPNAFRNGGLTFSMVGTILIGILCTHCVHILVKSSHIVAKKARMPSLTFAETGEQAFATGPKSFHKFATFAKHFVNGALVATYYGSLTVYVVFMAESYKQVFDYYELPKEALSTRIWIVIFLLPLSLLCLIRDLKYLVPFSWLANSFIVVGFGLTLYYLFRDLDTSKELDQVGEIGNMPLFFSTVIFAMEGIGVVMPIENSMKTPKHFIGCPGILNTAMAIVISLYAVIGFFGYMNYGECVDASITFNLPEEDIAAQVVKILVGSAIMFTYPLQFYVGTEIILGIMKKRIKEENFGLFQNIYRVAIVALTVAVAAAVPNLGPIISLVGAICFSTLGLLIPATIETAALYDGGLGVGKWRLYKNILISVIAIIALIFGTYASILEIIVEYTGEKEINENCVKNGTNTRLLKIEL